MSNLLVEILCGEIPSHMQQSAQKSLEEGLQARLKEGFDGKITTHSWVTPRRIGVYVDDLLLEVKTAWVRGPKITAPKMAIDAFMKKYNLQLNDLQQEGEYHFAMINANEDPKKLLSNMILEELKSFTWPKSMRWNVHKLKWIRPIENILILLDGDILPFRWEHIESTNITYGNRFLGEKSFTISSYANYKKQLEKIILTTEGRKIEIKTQIDQLIAKTDITMIPDDNLLEEVAGLVESPKVFMGEIPHEFLSLPKEVLITTLKKNQRYLMTQNSKGEIAPYYFIVANIEPSDNGKTIIEGNNRVTKARLADAKFFYEADLAIPLMDNTELLKKLVFYKDLGSVWDNQQHILPIANKLAKLLHLDEEFMERAVLLAKADLVSNMVKEFPELEGIMGSYYAFAQGENDLVAKSIKDHYKPRGGSDSIPNDIFSAALAVADKINLLNRMFAINVKPTGSKDPLGLRRAAIGILRIIEVYNIPIDKLNIREDVMQFIQDRNFKSAS